MGKKEKKSGVIRSSEVFPTLPLKAGSKVGDVLAHVLHGAFCFSDANFVVRAGYPDEAPNKLSGEELVFFYDQFRFGLRLPMIPEFEEVLRYYQIVPAQIVPNSISALLGVMAWLRLRRFAWNETLMRNLFVIKYNRGFVTFSSEHLRIIGLKNKVSKWNNRFVFVRCVTGWNVPTKPGRIPSAKLDTPPLDAEGSRILYLMRGSSVDVELALHGDELRRVFYADENIYARPSDPAVIRFLESEVNEAFKKAKRKAPLAIEGGGAAGPSKKKKAPPREADVSWEEDEEEEDEEESEEDEEGEEEALEGGDEVTSRDDVAPASDAVQELPPSTISVKEAAAAAAVTVVLSEDETETLLERRKRRRGRDEAGPSRPEKSGRLPPFEFIEEENIAVVSRDYEPVPESGEVTDIAFQMGGALRSPAVYKKIMAARNHLPELMMQTQLACWQQSFAAASALKNMRKLVADERAGRLQLEMEKKGAAQLLNEQGILLASRNSKVEELEARNAELRAQVTELTSALARAESNLDSVTEEKTALAKELAEVKNSIPTFEDFGRSKRCHDEMMRRFRSGMNASLKVLVDSGHIPPELGNVTALASVNAEVRRKRGEDVEDSDEASSA